MRTHTHTLKETPAYEGLNVFELPARGSRDSETKNVAKKNVVKKRVKKPDPNCQKHKAHKKWKNVPSWQNKSVK